MSIYVAPRPAAKAITGAGAAVMQTNPPLAAGLFINSAQMMMRAYWQSAHRNPWISGSERLISGKVSGVDWHLEVDGEDLAESTSPLAQAAISLIEKPQANLSLSGKPTRQMTHRELWNQTSRMMGLTGNAFWLMDERNAFGLPNSLLFIRPDRMTPAEDSRGNLTGWVLDNQTGASINGQHIDGIPLDLEAVLHFMLIPPDEGHFGLGLVETALRKAQLTDLADTYASGTLASGGRLSGIVSGTQNSPIPDEVFKQLVRDLRAVTEQPDAARRTTVVQGDINWKPTGMTPLDVGLVDIMKLSRDDTFGIWQAPFSLVYGGAQATGLNSGETRKYDEAALWQGPVHDRLSVISEVVQFQLFDRVAGGIQLVIEEPEFDDDSPRYDLLSKSINVAMTDDERRALIGKDPLPNGLGLVVRLPISLQEIYIAPPDDTPPSATEVALGRVVDTEISSPVAEVAGKAGKYAGLHASLVTLRENLQNAQTPRLRRNVAKFLDEQRHEIASRIREHAAQIARKPKDTSVWWSPKWDKALRDALAPSLTVVAESVSDHVGKVLAPVGKADPITAVLARGAARVTKINQTTKDAIASIIATGIDQELTLDQIADAIEGIGDYSLPGLAAFDDYRAELIARTELMDAYNSSALGSYGEAGVEMVEAIDGDEDDECIARLAGNPYTLEDAMGEEDHPNGTLDWVPV